MQQAVSCSNPLCHAGSNRVRLNLQALSEPSARWHEPVLLERRIRRRIQLLRDFSHRCAACDRYDVPAAHGSEQRLSPCQTELPLR
ncbi:hypothetical protein D3C77_580370 [compost metagenome]